MGCQDWHLMDEQQGVEERYGVFEVFALPHIFRQRHHLIAVQIDQVALLLMHFYLCDHMGGHLHLLIHRPLLEQLPPEPNDPVLVLGGDSPHEVVLLLGGEWVLQFLVHVEHFQVVDMQFLPLHL